MSIRRKLAAAIATVAVGATVMITPALTAQAESPAPTPWVGFVDPTTSPAAEGRVVAAGLDDTAVYAYDNFAPPTGGSGAFGVWDFGTTATETGPITVDFAYSGFHAFFQVEVTLEAYIRRAGVEVESVGLVDEGPVICCTPPSGGFSYTGQHTFDVQAGDAYGFTMVGENADLNSRLRGRLLVGAPGTVHEDTLVLDGFGASRTDGDIGLTEAPLTAMRQLLRDPDGFGPSGTSPVDFVVADGVDLASPATLMGTDVLFTGLVRTDSFTAAERQALVDFVTAGGGLIGLSEVDDSDLFGVAGFFGIDVQDGLDAPVGFVNPAHPIADGPFGSRTGFELYRGDAAFDDYGPYAVAVALDANERGVVAEIAPRTLGPRSGLALFITEQDFFSSYTADPFTVPFAFQETQVGNLFDYVATSREPSASGTAHLFQAVPAVDGSPRVAVAASVTGPPASIQYVTLVSSDECTGGTIGATIDHASAAIAVPASGEVVITEAVSITGTLGTYAALRVGDPTTGTLSDCVVAGPANDSWLRALELPLTIDAEAEIATSSAEGFLDSLGNSRWYRFDIRPGTRVSVDLSSLPDDYDVALFSDIAQAFVDVSTVDDLDQLGAEFAPSVFSPSVFSPSVFSPSVFSPDAYAPSVFSPSVFSPSVFSPSVFSPSVFSPSVFSPSVFSPSVFSPSVFSPSVFSPSVFSPSVFSPSVFSPENFASAQTRSLIAVSALPGTTDELVVADTWSNTGDFYVRVTGKNGEFDLEDPFRLDVTVDGVDCAAVEPIAFSGGPVPDAGDYRTLILHDPARLDGTLPGNDAAAVADLDANLAAYAGRSEVAGKVVDLGAYPHIAALHAQADANTQCPYAENLLASAIKDIVDGFRAVNPSLGYVTIVGSDAQVPFFRYPDQALLGPEQDYEPPVAELTQSQSALRRNYVLGQDEYGAQRVLDLAGGRFPLPQLAVGRIVESATEMNTVLSAYLSTANGVVDTPTSSLVTGYDFLTDNAEAVDAELTAGLNAPTTVRNDTLITAADVSPEDPASWTADQLRSELLDDGEDLVFLAGHFSANSALAADYETVALATELAASDVDLTNSIVFSGGCHSGYNIVDGDAVPLLTEPLDWTQAFAQQGATLVAGTGYQYGDTDFIEYSERLYVLFAQELRRGTGPVSVGDALARAKQQYLATTPEMRGLHRKSVLISTVFGLPNLQVDMPGERLPVVPVGAAVTPLDVETAPGSVLGLTTAELRVDLTGRLTERTVELDDLADPENPIVASYYEGPSGVVTNPAEPALPLVRENVTAAGKSLRGVGFRGGSWSEDRVVPLTGAPTTELRGVHTPFASTVNFPMRLAIPNYFGRLVGNGGTGLSITPVQHRVDEIGDVTATRRTFSDLDIRLYYSANTETYGANTPALSAPPTFAGVQARRDGGDVLVRARVVGDPAAGIQSVWVTYTDGGGSSGTWVSLDLTQDAGDSTVWSGRIVGGAAFARLDMVFQAVNGVGLVTLDDNYGSYYAVLGEVGAPPSPPPAATALAVSGPSSATYGETVTATAALSSDGVALEGRTVLFTLGGAARVGTTDASGVATAELPVTAVPGSYALIASFGGSTELAPTTASTPISVVRAATGLDLELTASGTELGAVATLADEFGTPLLQRTVVLRRSGPDGVERAARITDNLGRVRFGPTELAGVHVVSAGFSGDRVYAGSTTTRTAIVGAALLVPTEPTPITTPVGLTVLTGADGLGTASATVDWGDGTVEPLGAPTATHLYADAGVYEITVRLTDVDGTVSTATSDFVVVYDPSAGFVTGGGWVWSAPGAVVDRPDVEGKATFGFVSKYRKGATVPTGNTNFHFKAADLEFESTAYDWLVVAGSKGQFRGQGTMNGEGSHDFALTAVEGDPSTFRLQIWSRDGGGLVYDTQRGDGVTGDGAPLGGGSVKIHTPK